LDCIFLLNIYLITWHEVQYHHYYYTDFRHQADIQKCASDFLSSQSIMKSNPTVITMYLIMGLKYHITHTHSLNKTVAVTQQRVTDSFYLWLLSKRKLLSLIHTACVTAWMSNVTLRLPSNTPCQLRFWWCNALDLWNACIRPAMCKHGWKYQNIQWCAS
jgi:hypothetical protein